MSCNFILEVTGTSLKTFKKRAYGELYNIFGTSYEIASKVRFFLSYNAFVHNNNNNKKDKERNKERKYK